MTLSTEEWQVFKIRIILNQAFTVQYQLSQIVAAKTLARLLIHGAQFPRGLRLSAGPSAAGLRRGGIRWIHREPPHPHGAAGRRGERWGRPLAAEGKRRRQARDAGSAPAAAGCGAAVGGGGGDGGSGGVGVGRRRGPSAAPPRPPAPSHAVVMEEPRWRRWPTPGASGRSTTTSA